jgi:hypothetical protein
MELSSGAVLLEHLLTLAEPSGASQSGWDCPSRSTRPAAALEVNLLRGFRCGAA